MISEFHYLGKDKAYEIVIANSNFVADMISDTFVPFDTDAKYPNEADRLKEITYDTAYKKYGAPLPRDIKKRIESELYIICGSSRSVMKFIIGEKIAQTARKKDILSAITAQSDRHLLQICLG